MRCVRVHPSPCAHSVCAHCPPPRTQHAGYRRPWPTALPGPASLAGRRPPHCWLPSLLRPQPPRPARPIGPLPTEQAEQLVREGHLAQEKCAQEKCAQEKCAQRKCSAREKCCVQAERFARERHFAWAERFATEGHLVRAERFARAEEESRAERPQSKYRRPQPAHPVGPPPSRPVPSAGHRPRSVSRSSAPPRTDRCRSPCVRECVWAYVGLRHSAESCADREAMASVA